MRISDWFFGTRSERAAPFEDALTAELNEIAKSRRQRCKTLMAPAEGQDPV